MPNSKSKQKRVRMTRRTRAKQRIARKKAAVKQKKAAAAR